MLCPLTTPQIPTTPSLGGAVIALTPLENNPSSPPHPPKEVGLVLWPPLNSPSPHPWGSGCCLKPLGIAPPISTTQRGRGVRLLFLPFGINLGTTTCSWGLRAILCPPLNTPPACPQGSGCSLNTPRLCHHLSVPGGGQVVALAASNKPWHHPSLPEVSRGCFSPLEIKHHHSPLPEGSGYCFNALGIFPPPPPILESCPPLNTHHQHHIPRG